MGNTVDLAQWYVKIEDFQALQKRVEAIESQIRHLTALLEKRDQQSSDR